ncbi:MAG: di-heme oxidoredictase family protein, partial [Steroidobacteraceae bacterium]
AARPQDDCTPLQAACRQALQGGTPEVSAEFLEALLTFQREVAVPKLAREADPEGAALFESTGCALCHRPTLPSRDSSGEPVTIRAFTDLLVHDLGDGLADRTVDGRAVTTRFRTAPLWGLGYELTRGPPALLHDGRAGSLEEAILWHGGQAVTARRLFLELPAEKRATLVRWIATQ